MKNSLKIVYPMCIFLIITPLLITHFISSLGTSVLLSLGILFGIALLGILTGEFLCEINRRLRGY